MAEEHLQYEGNPIEVFIEKEKQKEVAKELQDTISQMKKYAIKPVLRPKYPPAVEPHGRPRPYSDEEIEQMNMNIQANVGVKDQRPLKQGAEARRERLFAYIKKCIEEDKHFCVAGHVLMREKEFGEFMHPLVRPKSDTGKKYEYTRSLIYNDLRMLIKAGKIYKKGSHGTTVYYLGKGKQDETIKEVSATQRIVAGESPDIVQRVVLEIVIKVRHE